MATRARMLAGALAAAALLLVLGAGNALAQAPNQVTGLTVFQEHGFATLAWDAVEGATDYQIERTPVDADGVPTGPAQIVGVWQPLRTITPHLPRFADAGFALGGRYQWRVRARFGSTDPQPFSEPVVGTTQPQWGSGPGAGLRTQWESSGNATYTSDVNEWAYTAAVDELSDRVRVVELGRTNPVASAPDGRPINMLIVGYPTPPATAEEISGSPAIVYYCNVHGNEPQGRESCLIFARMLAFTEDPHLLEILSEITVLIVPSSNPNGRAANTRGNDTGQDLNRDHALLEQPETKAFATVLRDYTPEVGIDLHEGDSEDLPILSSRHLNVFEGLFSEAKSGLVEGWMYENAAVSGWWAGPYSNGGDSHEGILRNTFGLKNVIGMLAENRASGGPTRPAEGNQLANRNRKTYGSLWEEFQVLEYYWTRRAGIGALVEDAVEFQTANTGRVVLRGSYPWPLFPAFPPHPLPNTDAPDPDRIIDPPPCGYFLTDGQYGGAQPVGTVELRLGLHGIAVDERPAGNVVRLRQPLRGLIPTLLDADAVSPEPMVEGQRLFACPHADAAPRMLAASAVEETEATATVAVSNETAEPEDLEWTVTEAESDCSAPSDLPWVSATPAAGTTGPLGATEVTVTFSAAGITAPETRSGVLCISTNDAGEPVIAIPLAFQVEYPFGGFLPPIGTGENAATAGSALPVQFSLGGDRGLEILADGSPASQEIDCTTWAPTGPLEPTSSPGGSGLQYSAATDAYTYIWKTSKGWDGTCRQLVLTLDDASAHVARFAFH